MDKASEMGTPDEYEAVRMAEAARAAARRVELETRRAVLRSRLLSAYAPGQTLGAWVAGAARNDVDREEYASIVRALRAIDEAA